jgi:hypothetical protein
MFDCVQYCLAGNVIASLPNDGSRMPSPEALDYSGYLEPNRLLERTPIFPG